MASKNDDDGFGDKPVSGDIVDPGEAELLKAFPGIAEQTPEAIMDRMAARVRSQTTLDGLFDALSGNSSDSLVGKSFEFDGVAWQAYESDRGLIPQAVCQVVDLSTGEATEFVTTAWMLVNFLRQAEVIGVFPFKARIVGRRTKRGQTALNFERV